MERKKKEPPDLKPDFDTYLFNKKRRFATYKTGAQLRIRRVEVSKTLFIVMCKKKNMESGTIIL